MLLERGISQNQQGGSTHGGGSQASNNFNKYSSNISEAPSTISCSTSTAQLLQDVGGASPSAGSYQHLILKHGNDGENVKKFKASTCSSREPSSRLVVLRADHARGAFHLLQRLAFLLQPCAGLDFSTATAVYGPQQEARSRLGTDKMIAWPTHQ
ncbi:unnamed protein product [Amoebophrya sp. A120]|nr:unnamed protein product [Amoebophrya sp. A120]|eukprot:GSA120T00023415001.1